MRLQQRQQPVHDLARRRRTAGDHQIHGQKRVHTAKDGGGPFEHAAVDGAVTDGDDEDRVGHGLAGLAHGLGHVAPGDAGDQEDVGVAGAGGENEAVLGEVVDQVLGCPQLQLTTIAAAGGDVADGEAAAEFLRGGTREALAQRGGDGGVGLDRKSVV